MYYSLFTCLEILLCVALIIHILGYLKPLIIHFSSYSDFILNRFRHKSSIEAPFDDFDDSLETGKYDVKEFNKRIEKIKNTVDADGLYDYSETMYYADDVTGTEIISEQLEKDLDRRLGF